MKDLLWEPSRDRIEQANVTRFMKRHGIRDYDDLVRRSTQDTSWFWDAAQKDLGLLWDVPYTQVQDGSKGFPWTRWFLGGKLNIVRNCIDRGRGAQTAILWH